MKRYLVLLCHRFPFIACEIFTCEVDIILKALVENEEVFTLLFLSYIFILPLYYMLSSLNIVYINWLCHFGCQLMNLLFSFLEPEHTHSTLLAGYFSKVSLTTRYISVNYASLSYVFLCSYL